MSKRPRIAKSQPSRFVAPKQPPEGPQDPGAEKAAEVQIDAADAPQGVERALPVAEVTEQAADPARAQAADRAMEAPPPTASAKAEASPQTTRSEAAHAQVERAAPAEAPAEAETEAEAGAEAGAEADADADADAEAKPPAEQSEELAAQAESKAEPTASEPKSPGAEAQAASTELRRRRAILCIELNGESIQAVCLGKDRSQPAASSRPLAVTALARSMPSPPHDAGDFAEMGADIEPDLQGADSAETTQASQSAQGAESDPGQRAEQDEHGAEHEQTSVDALLRADDAERSLPDTEAPAAADAQAQPPSALAVHADPAEPSQAELAALGLEGLRERFFVGEQAASQALADPAAEAFSPLAGPVHRQALALLLHEAVLEARQGAAAGSSADAAESTCLVLGRGIDALPPTSSKNPHNCAQEDLHAAAELAGLSRPRIVYMADLLAKAFVGRGPQQAALAWLQVEVGCDAAELTLRTRSKAGTMTVRWRALVPEAGSAAITAAVASLAESKWQAQHAGVQLDQVARRRLTLAFRRAAASLGSAAAQTADPEGARPSARITLEHLAVAPVQMQLQPQKDITLRSLKTLGLTYEVNAADLAACLEASQRALASQLESYGELLANQQAWQPSACVLCPQAQVWLAAPLASALAPHGELALVSPPELATRASWSVAS